MDVPYDIQERTFLFSCRLVTLCRAFQSADHVARRLAFQLLDAGTSVGANLEEADAGQTKPDFIAKASIARKACGEAKYWLRLLAFAEPNRQSEIGPLLDECRQLVAILTTIVKNAQSNRKRGEA